MGTGTVKLQGIRGELKGTATKELKVGDVIVWNYGYKSEVVEINPSKTGKTITFMLKSLQSGEINKRRMGAETLVVLEEKEEVKKTENTGKWQVTYRRHEEGVFDSEAEALNKIRELIESGFDAGWIQLSEWSELNNGWAIRYFRNKL